MNIFDDIKSMDFNEDDIKTEFIEKDDVKHSMKRQSQSCPFCGHEMKGRMLNGYVFCNHCHRRMPWKIYDNEQSVKDMVKDDTP